MSKFSNLNPCFSFVASTGRTATTFIAKYLNSFEGIAGLHEGTVDEKSIGTGLLPEINIENRVAYSNHAKAFGVVAEKRSNADLNAALEASGSRHIIDVAYYNATLARALLETHASARMVGIIRDCGSFVRSSTTISGEDPLPVGWPSRSKDLTDRERFISIGRIRPGRGHADRKQWDNYTAIRRNIWLWRETNLCLIAAQDAYPDRVTLIGFEDIRRAPQKFWSALGRGLGLENLLLPPDPEQREGTNKKPFGYQVPPVEQWQHEEKAALYEASKIIEEKAIFYV
jgi:hypothetical protein